MLTLKATRSDTELNVRPRKSSGVRTPQRKISHLAEFFEVIFGVDGHEQVQMSGSY